MGPVVFRVILGGFLGMSLMGDAVAVSDATCFRFRTQWKVSAHDKKLILKKYGTACFSFDKRGRLILKGFPASLAIRVRNLYNQCMKDGCVFCDAGDGSCEQGNCGLNNSSCKPYMKKGRPVCGEDCIYYALHQI